MAFACAEPRPAIDAHSRGTTSVSTSSSNTAIVGDGDIAAFASANIDMKREHVDAYRTRVNALAERVKLLWPWGAISDVNVRADRGAYPGPERR